MSVKRSSTTDTVYPLKKRALLEHRKLHEAENCGTSLERGVYQDATGCYGNGIEVTGAGDFTKTSDSGIIDTCLPISRETSPTSEQTPPDYQTPERVPLSLRNNYKLISKPLFPSSDSEKITNQEVRSTEDTREINEQPTKFAQLNQNILDTEGNSADTDIVPRPDMVRNNLTLLSDLTAERSDVPYNKLKEIPKNIVCDKFDQNEATVQKREVNVQKWEVNVQKKDVSLHNALKISNLANIAESTDKMECKVCGLEFVTQSQLIHHAKQHRDIIRCWKCREEFPSAERLNFHMKLEHKGENPYKCETCSREFTQYNNLRRHQRVHRENLYKCNLCDREFNEEFYLKMHMGTHTGNRVYSCGVCRAEFPSNHDLKMHVKTHSPSLLHTCTVCGKSFSKACVLRQHKKCHSGQRPHKCSVCEKTFIHRHHLTMHMKSHTEEERKIADQQKVESLGSEDKNTVEGKKEHENDVNSSKEMSYENKNSENLLTDSAEKCHKKSSVTCNKNLFKQFLNIPQNIEAAKSGKLEKSCWRGKSSMAHSTEQSQFSSNGHVQPLCQESRPVNFSYTMNTMYPVPYHSLQNISLAHNQMHPSFVHPMFPGSTHLYGDLYKQYTEQVQSYINNVYMMNLLSQTAKLQTFQGQGYSGLQGEGHKLSHSRTQLSAGNNTVLQDQCNTKMKGEGHILSQDKGQQLSDKAQQISNQGQGQDDSSLNVINATKNVPDVKQSEPTSIDPSAANLDVIIRDEHVEVCVVKCVDDETIRTCSLDSSNVKVFSNTDEHEIAKEMIKMSTGLNCGTEDVDDKPQIASESAENEKNVNHVKTTQEINFVSYINGMIEDTLKKHSTPDASNENELNVECKELRGKSDSKSNDSNQSEILEQVPGNNLCVLSNINDSNEKQWRKDDGSNLHHQQTSMQNPRTCRGIENNHIIRADDRLSISTSVSNGYTSSTNIVACVQQSPWQTSQYRYILSQSSDSNNSGPALVGKVEEAEKNVTYVEVRNHLPWMKKHDETQKDSFEEPESDPGERSHGNDLYHNESNRINEYETEGIDKFDACNEEEVVSISENGCCRKENLEEVGKTSEFLHKLHVDIEGKIDNFHGTNNSPTSDLGEKRLEIDVEIDEEIDGNDEVKPSEKVNISALNVLRNDNSLWNSDESVGRAYIVNSINGANDNKTQENTHSSSEHVNDVNINESQAIDLRTKVRNTEEIKPMIRSVAADENKCVAPELKSPRKLKFPRDLYVIKRSDILKNRSHNVEGPSTQYCPECRQSYFMETSKFLDHLAAHKKDKKTENETTKEKREKDLKEHGMNVTRSPKRSVLKQIDLNSPTKKKVHSGKPMHANSGTKESLKLYKCEICSRSFSLKHNLNRHKICHNSKQHECNICGRSFKEQFYLKMHMKVHIDESKQLCDVCGQNVLKSDFEEHTNEHFYYMAENPTYSQIGDRVREILHTQKSSPEVLKGESVLFEQITKFPNMKGTLDELAELMKLTKSSHMTGVVPLDKM